MTVWTYASDDGHEFVPAVIPAKAEVIAQVLSWGARGTGGTDELAAV